MYEYETFVYLDVQKTGTTFIRRFLEEFCTEKQLRRRTHHGVHGDFQPGKFHFISIRDPLDQYVSLYSYGSEQKGPLYKKFVLQGHGDLYDGSWGGFKSWLDFVLDPENAGYLSRAYEKSGSGEAHRRIGFQTYRFLTLAVPDAGRIYDTCDTKEAIRAAYESQKIANFTIRHETFRADLEELVGTKLRHSIRDLDAALAHLKNADPVNASDRVDRRREHFGVSPKRQKALHEREWLLHDLFGY